MALPYPWCLPGYIPGNSEYVNIKPELTFTTKSGNIVYTAQGFETAFGVSHKTFFPNRKPISSKNFFFSFQEKEYDKFNTWIDLYINQYKCRKYIACCNKSIIIMGGVIGATTAPPSASNRYYSGELFLIREEILLFT